MEGEELALEDIIYGDIASHIKCAHLEVNGDGQHFEAVVVSAEFEGKSRLERHRLVYKALGERMAMQIHALSLKLYDIKEWEKNNG
jgi:acid stress-induced BolA-like protein IbaG/YrbA